MGFKKKKVKTQKWGQRIVTSKRIYLAKSTHHRRNSLNIVEHLLVPHARLRDPMRGFRSLATTLKGKFYPRFIEDKAQRAWPKSPHSSADLSDSEVSILRVIASSVGSQVTELRRRKGKRKRYRLKQDARNSRPEKTGADLQSQVPGERMSPWLSGKKSDRPAPSFCIPKA